MVVLTIVSCTRPQNTVKAGKQALTPPPSSQEVKDEVVVLPQVELKFQPLAPEEFERQTEERIAVWNPWFHAAGQITNASGDPLAKEVIEFMQERGSIAAPDVQGARFLEAGKGDNWFVILPMIEADTKVSPMWKDIWEQKAAANFMPDKRALIIKSQKVSVPWKGLITLHEGLHAYRFMTLGYDWNDHKIFCYMELEAHTFQNRLTSFLGDKPYADFLQDEVAKMKKNVQSDGRTLGKEFDQRAEFYPELEKIFGKHESSWENDVRCTHVWLHICFQLIDQEWKGDKDDQKARLLMTLYIEKGGPLHQK